MSITNNDVYFIYLILTTSVSLITHIDHHDSSGSNLTYQSFPERRLHCKSDTGFSTFFGPYNSREEKEKTRSSSRDESKNGFCDLILYLC